MLTSIKSSLLVLGLRTMPKNASSFGLDFGLFSEPLYPSRHSGIPIYWPGVLELLELAQEFTWYLPCLKTILSGDSEYMTWLFQRFGDIQEADPNTIHSLSGLYAKSVSFGRTIHMSPLIIKNNQTDEGVTSITITSDTQWKVDKIHWEGNHTIFIISRS